MKCEEFRQLIDRFIDDDLNIQETEAMHAHAAVCPECAEELHAAMAMKDVLSGVDDDIVVPLEAQASWRKAVRNEAARQKNKKLYRIASAVAASLVLVFGCTMFLKGAPKSAEPVAMLSAESESEAAEEAAAMPMAASAPAATSIASDGVADESVVAQDYYAELKYSVTDINAALDTVNEIVAEYSGELIKEETVSEDNRVSRLLVITVDSTNADDLINSLSHLGSATMNTVNGTAEDTAVVSLTLTEE